MLPRTGCQTPTRRRTSEDFPEPLGPITPRPCPASSSNATSWTTIFATPGGATRAFDGEPVRRRLQLHRRQLRRGDLQQPVQPMPALARGDEALPVCDCKIDWCERARTENRSGDNDAGAGLL